MTESFPKAGAPGWGWGVGGAEVLPWWQVSQGLSVQLPGFSEVSLSVPKGMGLTISVFTNFTFIFMDSPPFISLFCLGHEGAMAPVWSSKACLLEMVLFLLYVALGSVLRWPGFLVKHHYSQTLH